MLATALLACGSVTSAVTGGGTGGTGLPIALGAVAAYTVAATILAIGLLMLTLIVILSRRGGPAPAPVPLGATLSPDGNYWWDGMSWRPVSR